MKQQLLLPQRFKKFGWMLIITATALGIYLLSTDFEGLALNVKTFAFINHDFTGSTQFFTLIKVNITNTLVGAAFIIGGLLVAFSREKFEDEYISKLRQSSLTWAVLINYLLLLISFIFIYGTVFLNVMLFNMFTVLIIFIIRFNFVLYRKSKWPGIEK